MPEKLLAAQRNRFLDIIRGNPAVGLALAVHEAGIKGVGRREMRDLIEADEQFHELYLEARGRSREQIRREITRRAITGVDEPVFQGGEQIGVVRKYSDALLAKMAAANLPEYRDASKVELTGAGGGPVQVEKREVDIVGVLAALARADALPEQLRGSLAHLAGAGEVLPAQPD